MSPTFGEEGLGREAIPYTSPQWTRSECSLYSQCAICDREQWGEGWSDMGEHGGTTLAEMSVATSWGNVVGQWEGKFALPSYKSHPVYSQLSQVERRAYFEIINLAALHGEIQLQNSRRAFIIDISCPITQ